MLLKSQVTMAASLRASQEGLDLVDQARKKKKWNKTAQVWIDLACTSKATLRRFWSGIPIQSEAFEAICKAVGIEDWVEIVEETADNSNTSGKKRKHVTLTLDIDFDSLDNQKLQAVITEFISLGGDQSINLMDVDEGSTKIIFNGSKAAIEKILDLYKAGHLHEICDVVVKNINLTSQRELESLIRNNGGRCLDLDGVNLEGANLMAANLEGASLRAAILVEANLEGAKLDGAILEGAKLDGANLYGAALKATNLKEAILYGVNLNRANLERANLERANIYGAFLNGARLYRANPVSAVLEGAILDGANLYGANLNGTRLYGARLYRVDLTYSNLHGASLYGASLNAANLDGANLDGANLCKASLYRTSLIKTNFNKAKLDRAQFSNNQGLSEEDKINMRIKGAIFIDAPESDVPSLIKR